jgi:protein arginine kinase
MIDQGHILSSRVRLARNFKKFPFRTKLNHENARAMVDEAVYAATNVGGGSFFRSLDLNSVSELECRVFLEKHIVSPEIVNVQLPKGLVISDCGNVSVMINEEDHVRIQAVKPGDALENALGEAMRLDDLVEENVEYAFHSDYGYLTSCPTNVGTGMRASYMIHLPCLDKSDQLKALLPGIAKFGITMRGIYGEGTAPMGSIYQISNQHTLGKSEAEIINNLRTVTSKVTESEDAARGKLLNERRDYLEDKIHRAYGILSHARRISAQEAMDLLSDIRLGYATGILTTARPPRTIYQIMMEIGPGHLQRSAGQEMSESARDLARATYLREKFT